MDKAKTRTTRKSSEPSRHIPSERKLLLAVAAGGRCEFRGCNEYLFEHSITLEGSNFSENAHIHAFSQEGPRGEEAGRPDDIHSSDNLMLLCKGCHHLIDDKRHAYTLVALREMKGEHEERIRYLTGLAPELKTQALILKGMIADRAVDVSFDEIRTAVAPRYPVDRKGFVIDVTNLGDDRDEDYFSRVSGTISNKLRAFYERGIDGTAPAHVSVFALASIPLLVLFGRQVSDKVAVDFFQRHREPAEPWRWRTGGERLSFETRRVRSGEDVSRVGLMLSVSGSIDRRTLPSEISEECPLFEICVSSEAPDVRALKRREDLDEFRRVYGRFLARVMAEYPACRELHLFPAVPAPFAVMCGHERLPKVQPTLCVYDNDKQRNGFVMRLRIDDHEQQ